MLEQTNSRLEHPPFAFTIATRSLFLHAECTPSAEADQARKASFALSETRTDTIKCTLGVDRNFVDVCIAHAGVVVVLIPVL